MNTKNLPIRCQFSAEEKQLHSDGTWVHYSVTNISESPIEILPWFTPFEGFMSKLFIVIDKANKEIEYQGPMVKRTAPEPSDYILIEPGETKSTKLNLQQAYNLTSSHYKVTMTTKYVQLKLGNELITRPLCQNDSISIEVSK